MAQRYIPYGYQIADGERKIQPEEAPAVQWIFSQYVEGFSYNEIAGKLSKSGYPKYNKSGWTKHHIKRILENSRYKGNNEYPTIVISEEFERARNVHDHKLSKWKAPTADKSESVLWQRMVCGKCDNAILRVGGAPAHKGTDIFQGIRQHRL